MALHFRTNFPEIATALTGLAMTFVVINSYKIEITPMLMALMMAWRKMGAQMVLAFS